jgi:ABC-type transport system involved in multi-copper enzyme maturation permease subunit
MTTTTAPAAPAVRTPQLSAPSLLTLTRVELRKSYDTRAGRWLLIVIGLAALGVVTLELFVEDAPKTFADYFAFTQFPVGVLLPVLGILLVTSEWSQRTAMTTFALVPRRARVLSAKVVAAVLLAVGGVLAAALASALATVLTPVFTDSAMDWGLSAAQAGQVLLVQVISVLAGVAFGMLLLSSPLAIVLYFVLPTAFTILVNTVSALDWVRDWLDLSTTTMPMYDGDLDGQGWLQVATSVALWLALPMVLGWLRIRRAEIS